ncbi:MAG: hypothetical protein KAR06_07380 [Deltaproteobacteria bacterium]|nr:hypothetical protein [Deltaproteobacteria bacterium]
MNFKEFLKIKKEVDPETEDMNELMDKYYDEYTEFMMGLKDGCGPDN